MPGTIRFSARSTVAPSNLLPDSGVYCVMTVSHHWERHAGGWLTPIVARTTLPAENRGLWLPASGSGPGRPEVMSLVFLLFRKLVVVEDAVVDFGGSHGIVIGALGRCWVSPKHISTFRGRRPAGGLASRFPPPHRGQLQPALPEGDSFGCLSPPAVVMPHDFDHPTRHLMLLGHEPTAHLGDGLDGLSGVSEADFTLLPYVLALGVDTAALEG